MLSAEKKAKQLELLKKNDPLGYYIQMAENQAAEARAANLARYDEMQKIYDEIVTRYQPGGGFMAGAEAGLEQQKGRDVAAETAQTISSGLYGTTVPSTAAKRWEMDVGAPQRLKLEDIRTQALTQAQQAKAGAIERREDVYPDYSSIAQLLSQAAARPAYSTSAQPAYTTTPSYATTSYAEPYTTPSYTPFTGGYAAPGYPPTEYTTTTPSYTKPTPSYTTSLVAPITTKAGVQIGTPTASQFAEYIPGYKATTPTVYGPTKKAAQKDYVASMLGWY